MHDQCNGPGMSTLSPCRSQDRYALLCICSVSLVTPDIDTPLPNFAYLVFDVSRTHRLVFQNLLMESDSTVLSNSQSAWTALLAAASSTNFPTAASPQLTSMLFDLACTPTGHVLAPKQLLKFPMPASSNGLLPPGSRPGAEKHMLGVEEGFDVARMRLAAAGALGQLACKFAALGKVVAAS